MGPALWTLGVGGGQGGEGGRIGSTGRVSCNLAPLVDNSLCVHVFTYEIMFYLKDI